MNRSEELNKIKTALLVGLKYSGRKKTFKEILDEAHIESTATQRFEIANALEEKGLIKAVTYQFPVSIRAELTDAGAKAAQSCERKLTKRELRSKGYH